jgi:ribosomal protein S3
MLKAKVTQSKNENRLFRTSKKYFISNLTTTLTLLTKYLDPQPFADHLAKIIGKTKNHASILQLVKIVLRTLRFKRGLGYRIALSGRINGTNKSRTFYLKKLYQNRSRQTFSKNVNFAMSQARATIGALGIRI